MKGCDSYDPIETSRDVQRELSDHVGPHAGHLCHFRQGRLRPVPTLESRCAGKKAGIMVAGNWPVHQQLAVASADLARNRTRTDAFTAVLGICRLRPRHLVGGDYRRPQHPAVLRLVLSYPFPGDGHSRLRCPAGHRHRVLAPLHDHDAGPGQSDDRPGVADAAERDLCHGVSAGRLADRADGRSLVHVESGRLAGVTAVRRHGETHAENAACFDLVDSSVP